MAQTLSIVTIDSRDRIMTVPNRQRWYATCGVLGMATADSRGIATGCSFSGAGPLPFLRSGQRVGTVYLAGVLDDVPDDPELPTLRQIVMAGVVDRGDVLRATTGRYPELDLGGDSISEPDSAGVAWFTVIEFAALTAGTDPAFENTAFAAGTPGWLHR